MTDSDHWTDRTSAADAAGDHQPAQGPAGVPTSERMATLGAAKAGAIRHKLQGDDQTQQDRAYTTELDDVQTVVEDWPAAPKKAARLLLEQYGAPNEATPTTLTWYRNGPWKRSVLSRDEIVHNFPTAHTDFLTQYIDYAVPIDKFDDIAAFDGSCLADRTTGEVAARCDSEAMNILTLNLMDEIVTGVRSVEDARHVYAENAAGHAMGRSAPYAEQLRFTQDTGTADPDESMIGGAMARQMAGKAGDMMTGDQPPAAGPG